MRRLHLSAIFASSAAIAVAIAAPAHAQDTTSAITGHVTNDQGASVGGARVTVVHVPSGTRASTASDGSGNFDLRGLRVGGPYTVTIETPGFAPETVDNVYLTIGDTLGLPVRMSQREILVTAAAAKGARQLATGSVTSFRADDIANIVSARRDVRDIMRRDILSSYNANTGGVSIAGGNIRTQRFSVDGVQMQDSFGLNYGGLPSTRGIVSIEAIDQLTVKAAPFDISEGNFQGGAVNVVLKSGTNKFHLSGFGNFGGSSLTGTYTAPRQVVGGNSVPSSPAKILDFRNYGGSLSGPIIKDKLFFTVAYEKLTEGFPDAFGVQGGGAPNAVPNLFYADTPSSQLTLPASGAYPFGQAGNANYQLPTGQATYPSVLQGLTNLYNVFNTAGYAPFAIGDVPTAITERDEKYSAKLDWNIAEGQRFTASYIHHENVIPNFYSGTVGGSTSATTPNILLLSDLYKLTEHTDAFAAQLNSKWSDHFSTELRFAYKYYRRGQDAYNGTDYAQFNVCLDPTSSVVPGGGAGNSLLCGNGTPTVKMGPDTPRQANQFNNRIYTFQGNATYTGGAHTIKAEFDRSYSTLYNLFVFNGATSGGPQGLYYFDSVTDFANRQANELAYTNTVSGNKGDGYVRWAYQVYTGGLQDTWKPSSQLTINAGLRYDIYTSSDGIALNSNFTTRYATLYPGLTNTATLDGRDKLQPRIGFNWAPRHDLRVAGGFGLFAGGLSDVFISNNYSNTGTSINGLGAGSAITSIDLVRTGPNSCIDRTNPGQAVSSAICSAALNGVNGALVPAAVQAYQQANTSVLQQAQVNLLDPNFKIPAQWKYNLSLTFRPDLTSAGLGDGWTFRADALFSDTQQGVRWVDLRSQPLLSSSGVVQVAPDGRPRYGGMVNGVNPGANYDIMLTNTQRGISRVFALGITKAFKDFDISLAYTHQSVHDVAGVLVSSTVSSTYAVPTSDPNSGGDYGRSAFEVTHIIRANLDFHHKFFGDNETRFNINWELRSGQPYSATMNDFSSTGCNGRACVFGTVNTTSHLLYVPNFNLVPTGGGLTYGIVTFADQATLNAVQNLVQNTVLSKYQGGIAPKNVLTGRSYNKVDLNFAQQIPFVHGSKFTALFSIENFLNFLNRDWGGYQDIGNTPVVRVACGSAVGGQTCGNYIYSSYSAPTATVLPKPSLYTIRAGVRFDF